MRQNSKDKDDDRNSSPAGTTPTGAPGMSDAWKAKMEPFFRLLDIPLTEGTRRILSAEPKLVGGATDRAAKQLADPTMVEPAALQAIFHDVPTADFREALQSLQGKARDAEATAAVPAPSTLPEWLDTRRVQLPRAAPMHSLIQLMASTSELAPDSEGLIQAMVMISLAEERLGDVPEAVLNKIAEISRAKKREVPAEYQEIEQVVRQRKFGQYTFDRTAATSEERSTLLSDLRGLHVAAGRFHQALSAWNSNLKQDAAALVLNLLRQQAPRYPNPINVVAAANMIVSLVTTAKSALGKRAIETITCEHARAHEILKRADLPRLLGKETPEEVKELLGLRVEPLDAAMERSVVEYVLAVATVVPKLSGNQAGPTLERLYELGEEIRPWMETGQIGSLSSPSSNRYPEPEPPMSGSRNPGPRRF